MLNESVEYFRLNCEHSVKQELSRLGNHALVGNLLPLLFHNLTPGNMTLATGT